MSKWFNKLLTAQGAYTKKEPKKKEKNEWNSEYARGLANVNNISTSSGSFNQVQIAIKRGNNKCKASRLLATLGKINEKNSAHYPAVSAEREWLNKRPVLPTENVHIA